MVIAVIDIGTNTARLLVAEVGAGRLSPVDEQRTFVEAGDPAEIAAWIGSYAERGLSVGAAETVVVATAALRDARLASQVSEACLALDVPRPRVLSQAEEARLAFHGALACEPEPAPPPVVVVDVGGGSTELVAGSLPGGPAWWHSSKLGSRSLNARAGVSNPPTAADLERMRELVRGAFAGVEVPASNSRLAIGDASLRRLCGETIDAETIRAGLEFACVAPAERSGLGIAPQRLRLMPAALILYEQLAEAIGGPLRIARGGLREGLALERAAILESAGEAA